MILMWQVLPGIIVRYKQFDKWYSTPEKSPRLGLTQVMYWYELPSPFSPYCSLKIFYSVYLCFADFMKAYDLAPWGRCCRNMGCQDRWYKQTDVIKTSILDNKKETRQQKHTHKKKTGLYVETKCFSIL